MRLSAEDYGRLERFYGLCVWKEWTAYVRWAWEEDTWTNHVLLSRDGSAFRVSLGGKQESSPVFSRDGALYFLSDGRIGVRKLDSEQAECVDCVPDGWEAVDAVPAGAGLVFAVRREIRELPPEGCRWEMPETAEELHYRNDADHGFRKKYQYRLCLYDGAVRELASGEKPFRCMAYVPENRLLYECGGFQVMDLTDGKTVPAGSGCSPAGDIRPAVSGDGRYALCAVHDGMQTGISRIYLDGAEHPADEADGVMHGTADGVYMDSAPGRHSVLAAGPEKDTFYVCGVRDFRPCLFRVTAVPGKLTFEKETLDGNILEAAADGETLCVMKGTDAMPPRPVRLNGGTEPPADGSENRFLRDFGAPRREEIIVPSMDGKVRLQAFLCLPRGKHDHLPLLVWIHGGPSGFWAPGFNLEVYAAVDRGYAVLLPNPRGSTGKGRDYADPEAAFDTTAPQDVLTLLDEALRRFPELDGTRMGVLGGSYGGYLSAWMAVHTRRFRAAVPIKAVTNWLFIHFRSSQAGQPVLDEYRDFEDFLVDTLQKSPVYYAGECRTPCLIIHGEKDQQVPVENAHQFYTALKDACPELPVRLMLLPDCCHAYSRDALPDYISIQTAALDWMDRFVKG